MSLTAADIFLNPDGSFKRLPTMEQVPWHDSSYYFNFYYNEWFILAKLLFQVWWLLSYTFPNEFWFNYVFGDKWDSFGDMIADGWGLYNYVWYLYFYETYRRMIYLVGFQIIAAFCSTFYYFFAWSYVFNHQAWELQADF